VNRHGGYPPHTKTEEPEWPISLTLGNHVFRRKPIAEQFFSRRVFTSLLLISVLAGCQPPASIPVETIEEEAVPEPLASSFGAADPGASQQLVKGFYDDEQNSWRWTMKEFAVALRPPVGGSALGATLRLHLTVPDPVIDQLGEVTLSAWVGEKPLDPETYSEAGGYVYERPIPSEMLLGDVVALEFRLDKAIPPGTMDRRELGIIFNSIELVTQ